MNVRRLLLAGGLIWTLLCLNYAQSPAGQQRAIITAWDECGRSIERENDLLQQLTKSFQLNPPWRVLDAAEPAKRAQLIEKIIAEHKRRIQLLERIRKEDGQ